MTPREQFTVQPGALQTYADLIGSDTAGPSALQAKFAFQLFNYTSTWVELDGPGWLFHAQLKPAIERIQDQLLSDASLISTLLVGSAEGLQSTAQVYRGTDQGQAERLDARFTPPASVDLEYGQATTGPVTDPVTALVPPSDQGGVPDLAQELLDGAGILSISDLPLKILRWCGLDAIGWVTDRFAGSP